MTTRTGPTDALRARVRRNTPLEAAKMQHALAAQGGPLRVETRARKATAGVTIGPGGCEICARNGVRSPQNDGGVCDLPPPDPRLAPGDEGDCALCVAF